MDGKSWILQSILNYQLALILAGVLNKISNNISREREGGNNESDKI